MGGGRTIQFGWIFFAHFRGLERRHLRPEDETIAQMFTDDDGMCRLLYEVYEINYLGVGFVYISGLFCF